MAVQNPATGNSLESVGTSAANSQPDANVSLESGMASMLSSEPASKPGESAGDTGKGSENNTQTETEKNPAWTSQLAKDISGNADIMKRLTKFTNISDLAKSYAELEGKIGNSIVKPGKDATAEETSAFYEKLGRPKDASGYSLKRACFQKQFDRRTVHRTVQRPARNGRKSFRECKRKSGKVT